MSQSFEALEVEEKCITSRLWYTASAILNLKIDNECQINNFISDHPRDLSQLIRSALEISENTEQYEWIFNILLLLLDKQNFAKTKVKLEIIQFLTNLELISNDIPERIKKELSVLFELILSVEKENILCANKISSSTLQFIESSLKIKPGLTCWLVNTLIYNRPNLLFPLDSALQDVYSNSLKNLLALTEIDKNLSAILCILSKLHITESKEDELLNWLFPHLVRTCNTDEIELSLYSRKNARFLKEWHAFLDTQNYRLKSVNNIENAEKISEVIFFHDSNNLNKIHLHAKELSLRTIRRELHWIIDILDLCLALIENKEYDKTTRILSCPVLGNIWPIILVYILHKLPDKEVSSDKESWQKSTNICESIKFLLNKCYSIQYENNELVLFNLNACLSSNLNVIKWILDYRKKYLSSTVYQHLKVRNILDGLQESCILSVLKKSINLHECSFNEIKGLLKDDEEILRVFRAYQAMKIALKAIFTNEMCKTQTKETRVDYYEEFEAVLNTINPISQRLEVIENIFSMLFLRYDVHFNQSEGISEEEGYETTVSEKERHSSINESRESDSNNQFGFICHKYAVKKILRHLKRCIVQLRVDLAKLRRENENTDFDVVQDKIHAIDEALIDACWRFELLTSQNFIESNDGDNEVNTYCDFSNDSDSVIDEKLSFSFKLKSKSIFYYHQMDSSSEEVDRDIRSDVDGSSETSSTDTNNLNKRKKRSKNVGSSTLIVDSTKMKDTNSKYTINLMLASKESLVLQCLWKGDHARAQQVIEKFKMKNGRLDSKVRFSKAMKNLRLEMTKQMSSPDSINSQNRKNKEFQIFENFRRAAQGSYHSSRVANLLETFVSSQESNARMLSTKDLEARDIITLSILDFALTIGQTHQASINLLEVAAKYLKLSRNLDTSLHSAHFSELYRLLHENGPAVSVPNLLCDATIPLTLHEWREETDFWCQLLDKTKKFLDTQSLLDKLENNENEADDMTGQKLFSEIIALCGNTQTYLHKVLAHLQILHSIVPPNEKSSDKTESVLLSNSIDSYFGHQIFDLNVEPKSLETVANKLGVSLVHNILVNCCPKLTCNDSLSTARSEIWGCIVLNINLNNTARVNSKSQDPNQIVADILSDLLLAIKRLYPNCTRILNKDLGDLIKDPEIQQILNRSMELENLDLSELSVGEHTLAFFLNLWNLSFLHTQLQVWITDPPINSLRKYISLSSVNYHVGDLGRISLTTLRCKLLGSMSWDTDFFSSTEDLNEVAWQDLDLTHDPRALFAMANEFYETPAIRVYYPQTLNKDLNQGLYDYLENYSEKEVHNSDKFKKIARLPKIVENYEKNSDVNLSSFNCDSTTINQLYHNIFSQKMIRKYEPVTHSYEILLKYDKNNSTKVDLTMKQSISSSYNNSSSWLTRSIKPNILNYLEGHCWLLSYLVKRVHKESSFMLESGCDNLQRTVYIENISSSPWIFTLASALFDENSTLASIQENMSLVDLWIYFEKCLKDDRPKDCLDVINALPSKLLIKCTEIQFLKDDVLCRLIRNCKANKNTEIILQYIYQIKDVNFLAQTVISNLSNWPVHLCKKALFHVLYHADNNKLPSHCRFKINETLCRVTVFYKMLPYCKNAELDIGEATWHDVLHCTQKTDPVCIIQSLVEANKFELCLEWLEYQAFSSEIQSIVTPDLLIGLLKNDETDFKNARKFLSALPTRQSLKMCRSVIKKLESISAMRFLIGYLLERCELHESIVYYKIQIGIDMLDQLEPKERIQYTHLIKEPLLMLEQSLMNCKFEILRKILAVLQRSNNIDKAEISIENFDKVVRFYAGKSLDFRVSLQRDGIESKIKDSVTVATSSDNESRNSEFIMPINVPSKEEWVPNDKARECSCCRAVIFSMFNRRHHCRRCGRVICAGCSQQRMQVPTYPKSVLVRVCDDCKIQTIQMQVAQVAPSTASSELECWKLTTDEKHNQTVREEFSFEHAPNISLCLAILSLHSDHKAYPSFLLDRCDEMKRLLQPVTGGRVNPEVDHALIIKMIRTLLVAVKVKCAKLGLNAGLAHCDRFLSQVDLIATLVQSDCLALIPSDDSLDEHALRKLRDLLTEKEQWTLALDVSTKSGLDTQGVWAAWGKACLKAGYFDRARTKFSHCLEKVLYENFDDWVLVSFPDYEYGNKSTEDSFDNQKHRRIESLKSESPNRKRQVGKSRPAKDPPLLLEILQILENQSQLNPDHSHSLTQSNSNIAQEILTTLNTLKAVSQGQCSLVHNWNSRSIYYEESLYYLLTFGSFTSILDFFVKHEEFDKCLAFVLENNVEPELFFNVVYLRCLNMGSVEKLLGTMKIEDASLLTWKKYLVYTCHSLDKKRFYHTLYHLQLFMKDYIRAAMTCIHFYTDDARNYVDLCSSSHFLIEAQKHLETELNMENISKKRKKSVSSIHSGSHSGLTMEMEPSEIDKHLNTISRQLEIAKFLCNSEKEGRFVSPYLKHLLEMDSDNSYTDEVPTLFGNQQQKTRLAVLAILCGRDAEEGFGIAFRIIQDYNLRPQKVYSLAGHVLALEKKIAFIEQLIKCCRSSGAPDSQDISDRVLTHCVKLLLQNPQTELNPELKDRVDSLIRLINDVELKISSYIESKQLKAAYLLAVKHQRAQDIRKILKEADRLGQNAIRSICTKWLKQTQSSA